MNTHADKTQENKRQSMPGGVAQKQSVDQFAYQLVDNRPVAIVQRKLQAMANNSPQSMQLQAFQQMATKRPQTKQAAQFQPKADQYTAQHKQVIQRVVTSAAAGGAVATLHAAPLAAWINNNASAKVKAIANHPDVNLNVVWDGGLGNPANTNMFIDWVDNVIGAQGPHNLFTAANAGLIGAINFANLAGYDIDIPMHIQTPQVAPATWRGTLIHELEAHTGLAYTTSRIIDQAIADLRKRAGAPAKIGTTMAARSVVAEHRNWAEGGGGSEDSMTRVVSNAPRGERVAIVDDIAGDRIREAQANWPAAAPDVHRIQYNIAMQNIRTWLRRMKANIPPTALTVAEAALIDAQIGNARNR